MNKKHTVTNKKNPKDQFLSYLRKEKYQKLKTHAGETLDLVGFITQIKINKKKKQKNFPFFYWLQFNFMRTKVVYAFKRVILCHIGLLLNTKLRDHFKRLTKLMDHFEGEWAP